jgi:hypothetical protein
MTPAQRVRARVESGSLTAEEGARLLAAMHESPPASPAHRVSLLDPFERFGGGTAVLLGAVISIASIAAEQLGIRFDGFIDVHVARNHTPTWWSAVADQLGGWILPALGFWAYARVFSRRVRVVDFLGMVGLARLSLLIGALATLPFVPSSPPSPMQLTPALALVIVLAVVTLTVYITLLYNGFKNASGLTGRRLVVGFVGLMIVLELASRVALVWLV